MGFNSVFKGLIYNKFGTFLIYMRCDVVTVVYLGLIDL